MSELQLGFQLLLVGMVTVFFILFLVVTIGNAIIRFVNRFLPEQITSKKTKKQASSAIDRKKMAAIVSAVQIVTQGKGKVIRVEKLN